MTIDDKITDKKLQYNIKTEVAKTSVLLSGKIDKCKYVTGKEILLFISVYHQKTWNTGW